MFDFKKIGFLKVFAVILMVAAMIVTIAGAAHIGYSYAEMQCMIEHNGASAPANIVFAMLIPYCLVIIVMLAAGIALFILDKKKKTVKNATMDDLNKSGSIPDGYLQDSQYNK